MAKKKKRTPLKNMLWLKKLLAQLLGQPMRFIRWTWRVEGVEMHPEAKAILASGKPVIYALWHGRMYVLFKAVPLQKVAILVSPSNDGEFITRIAQCIGFQHFIRGSHKRGGTQAILGMHRALKEDDLSVAFTVDGPRGPRYKVKPGIIRLAAQTGAPIIPLGSASAWLLKKMDKSWDHYHPPFLWTSMQLMYGKPLHVPADVNDAQITAYSDELESELMRINLAADAVYGFHHQERL